MLTLRPAAARGRFDFGWLDTRHTFSFGDYYDPAHMGFGPLRVINDDRVQPGGGFPPHGHRDMEILSYVLDGALAHRDSMGNGSVIRPGDVQRMSAGTGVTHSEENASDDAPVRFLQIWIMPARPGLVPGYEQRSYAEADRRGRLKLVASSDGGEGSVTLHQDVRLYAGLFDGREAAHQALAPGRCAWVQVARGRVRVGAQALEEGDGLAIEGETAVDIAQGQGAEILLFDLPRADRSRG